MTERKHGYEQDMSLPCFKKIEGLGSFMNVEDETYRNSRARNACHGKGPDCDTPGFDPVMLPDTSALLGRWVRSPSQFVGWDQYMDFFGLQGDYALQETEEPQEHIILEFSKKHLRIKHRLCWRAGLDCDYTVPIDGSSQPVPPDMVRQAASSWKANELASWEHAWDFGEDGNPLHRGLRTQQLLTLKGTNYALRYWRNLIRPRLMRINVEVTYADTGKYAVHTQRFFHKIDVDHVYAISCLPVTTFESNQLAPCGGSVFTHGGRGVRIVVLPHASNMPAGWKEKNVSAMWEMAEPFPTAGRSSGPFLTKIRQAAKDHGLWVVAGVTLRAKRIDETADEATAEKKVSRGVALIGADGWLHGVHADMTPPPGIYTAGEGDWPATQRARPRGVYDTELGRLAICCSAPNTEGVAAYAEMGAELVLVPPDELNERKGTHVALPDQTMHKGLTQYNVCGPVPFSPTSSSSGWTTTVASLSEAGVFEAICHTEP